MIEWDYSQLRNGDYHLGEHVNTFRLVRPQENSFNKSSHQ